jgi:hypothetical protein
VKDAELTGALLVCGAIEAAAWGAAWFFDWSTVSLVGAVAVSTAVAGIIVAMHRRRQQSGR